MRGIITALLIFSCSSALHGQDNKYISNINVQKGEHWWGAYAGQQLPQPLSGDMNIVWADDGGTQAVIPLLLSGNGRIIRSDEPFDIAFDGKTFILTSGYGKVEAESVGRTLRDAYLVNCHRYCPPSGDMPSADLFANVIYDTEDALGQAQGQQEILDYAAGLLEAGFPAGTVVIPYGWRSLSGGITMDGALYPDPKGMMEKLHSMGFMVMLTVTPYAPAAGRNYVKAYGNGSLWSESAEDAAYVFAEQKTGTYRAVYDFTRAEVVGQFREGLSSLPFTPDFLRFDCSAVSTIMPPEWHAAWMKLGKETGAVVYTGSVPQPSDGAVYDIAATGDGKPGYAGALINNIATASLLGVRCATSPFTFGEDNSGDDILPPTHRLAMMAGMPLAVVNFSPVTAALTADAGVIRKTVSYRAAMADYIRELISATARSGEPLVRNMEYQFPKSGFADCADQFLLGPKYMFAPSLGEAKRMVRIPKGTWISGNGRSVKGPRVIEIECGDPLAGCFELSDK